MLRKTNIYFYLVKRSKPSTIYCRITVDGDKKAKSTSQKVPKDYWNQSTQRVDNSYLQSDTINETLSVIENQVRQAENNLIHQSKPITLQGVLDETDQTNNQKTFLEVFHKHNIELKEMVEAGEYTKATMTKYNTMFKHTSNYIYDKYGKEDVFLSELNLDFIEDFYRWFRQNDISKNTAIKYLRQVKKISNRCLRKGYLQRDPFYGFSKTKDKKIPTYLTENEIQRLIDLDLSNSKRLDNIRDGFVFSCFTALAFSDAKKLTEDHISKRGEEYYLTIRRTKTDEIANILLLPPAKNIYMKHKDDISQKILPIPCNQVYNRYLKELQMAADIDKTLTTHVARHSCAVMLINNGLSLDVVATIMGHSDKRSTQHYARIVPSTITSDMEDLKGEISFDS